MYVRLCAVLFRASLLEQTSNVTRTYIVAYMSRMRGAFSHDVTAIILVFRNNKISLLLETFFFVK